MLSTRAQKQCRKSEHTVGVSHEIPEILIFGNSNYGYLNKNKCVLHIQKHRCGESLPAPTSFQAVSYPSRPKDKVAPARP